MKTRKPCANILKLLKKRLLLIIAGVVLYCSGVWGTNYYWCGGATGDWNTATNWNTTKPASNAAINGDGAVPGTGDTVIINTSSNSVSISFTSDIEITGFITYGTNDCAITPTAGNPSPGTFKVKTVFVGTSSNGFRTANGLPTGLDVPQDNSGNLKFDGSITVTIETLDTSSWTQDPSEKNTITLGSSTTFNVTSKWDTGINKQTNNRDRTVINSETGANIKFSGTAAGAQESIQTLFSDLSNAGADITEAKAQTQDGQPSLYIWKGTDTDWTKTTNWSTGAVPDSTASVIIPKTTNQPSASESDISSTKVKSISLSEGSELTIITDYTLSDANLFIASATGTATIKVSGKLTVSTDFDNENFHIETDSIETNAGLKAASIKINGTSDLNSSTAFLVGATDAGITFGGNVTVNAPGGGGIPVVGNINASSPITVTAESGVLNHMEEGSHFNWSDNITIQLKDNTTLSMSGNQNSKYKIETASDANVVYIAGSGTVDSITEGNNTAEIHFGTNNNSFNETINFSQNTSFNTTGKVIIDKSCKNLTGNIDLTLHGDLQIDSEQLDPLGVNFILEKNGTTAITSTQSITFNDVTFKNSATINSAHTYSNFTATDLDGKTLTITDDQTVNGTLSLSGTSSGNLEIRGTGTFVLGTDQYGGEYLTVDASGPSINTGKKYYAVNSQSSDNSDISSKGWIIFTAGVWVWKGTDTSSPEDWNTADNWLPPSVPTSTAKVFISSGRTYYPTLNSASNTTIDSLTMEDNTSLNAASKLIITSPVNFDKTLSLSGLFTDTAGITNSGSITISGNTTFDGNVTNTGSISIDSGKTLSISGNFDDSRSTAATTGAISFKGTGSFTPNTSTTYSNIEVNASGSTITVADTLETTSLTITAGTIVLNNLTTVNSTLSSSGTIDSNAEIVVQGNFTDSGTFTAGTNSKITLSGNTDQEFAAGTSTYENITVNKTGGKTSFTTNSLNANTVVLTASAGVDFEKSVTLTTITDSSASGDISFYENGTITNSADFQTTGNVTIAQNKTLTISNSADFTHTSGTTTLEGNITAANITMGNVSLKHGVTLTGNVTLSGGANASNKKSLDDSSSHTMTIKGNLIINDFYEIGTTRNQTIILDPVTGIITNNGTLSIPHSSSFTGDFKNNGTFTAGGTTVVINGNLTNTGSITINSGKNLSISGNFDDSGSTAATSGAISFTGITNQTFTPNSGTTYTNITENKSAGTLTVDVALTAGIYTITSGTTSTFSSTFDVTNLTITKATSTVFTGVATITNYSDSSTAGAITFSAGGTIKSATTMNTTGTVTIPASKTLAISNAAATPTYYDFTHSAGSTAIAGELKAAAISLGATTISGTTASVSGSSIATGAITATAGSDEFTLKASDGNFANIGQIGAATPGLTFTQVTLDADTADLSLNGNTIFANTLTMNPGTDKKIKLQGTITVNGTNGFVIPANKPEVELTAATTIASSGPITLYDNITGSKALTITNTGLFTLNETYATADPADDSSATTLNSSAALSSFTQNGTGSCNISGDITSTGAISFDKSITLSDNVKLIGTNITFNDSISDSGTNLLITSGTSTNFTGGSGTTVSASKFVVSAGNLIINKTAATDTITFNPAATVTSDIIVYNGDVTFSETVSTNGNLTNNSKLTLEKQTTVDGNFTNSASCTTETKAELKLSGNFNDSGTFTENAGSKITLTGTADQTFTPVATTTYKNINIDKSAGSVSFNTNDLKAAALSDTVANASSITFNKNATIKSATTLNTSGTVTIPSGVTLTLSDGNSTPVYYNFTHTAGPTALAGAVSGSTINLGTISLNGDSSLTATTISLNGGSTPASPNTFTGTATHTLTINGNLESDNYYNMGDSVAQSITLNSATNSYTNNGTTTLKNITFTGNLTNTATNSFTIAEDTTLNGSLTNAGTFTINSGKTFQLSTNFSNSGTVIFTDSTFELVNSSISSQITGTNTFHNFTCTAPGKTISFEAGKTQTINGKLTLTGTSGNLISLRSTSPGTQWKINCTGENNHSISFVDVQDSDNISSGYRLTAASSTDSGNNIRWDFTTVLYTWLGNNTNWFDEQNWDKGSIPGIGVKVTIPVVSSPKVYPVLEKDLLTDESADASIGSSGTITVESGAQIDFSNKSLTANTITNNGRIRLEGNQTISATTIENTQNSIVEYYGLCSGNQMNGNSGSFNYYNLEFTNGASGNITGDITIGGTTLIANGTGNELKLTGNNTVTGVVTVGTQSPSPVSAGNIVLNSNTLIAIEDSILCDSITLSNDLIIDADVAGTPKDIITTGTITAKNIVIYRGHVKANPNTTLSAIEDFLILGTNYNTANPESGNPAEFLYQQQRGTPPAAPNYTRPDFTVAASRPDGNPLPTITGSVPFSGSYSASSGSILKAGKNFYINGTTLDSQDSAQWYIDLTNLTDSANGYGETAYSSISYATIRCHINNSADGTLARMPAYYCTDNGNNNNWLFDNLQIDEVHTVRDDTIQITFNRPVRNLHGELTHADSIRRLYNSNGNNYVSFHTAPDCTDDNKLQNQNVDSRTIYLKAADSWNTDATGLSAGTQDSTDRRGIHKEIIPYLEVLNVTENKAGSTTIHITDIWGKKLGSYQGANRFTAVTDKTGPVLYSVRTGQENHTKYDSAIGAESQPSYDSHNFLEFRYSEQVNFGSTELASASPETPVFDNSDTSAKIWLPAAGTTITNDLPDIINVRVHDSFAALTNNVSQSDNLHFAGLGIIQSGQIFTAQKGSPDKYVNALYRTDKYSIRISIAGYTEGTVPDRNGASYKNWPGYIESAVQPTGTVQMDSAINSLVTDCAVALDGTTPVYNPQELYADSQTVPQINIVTSSGLAYSFNQVYSDWDISEPVFAPLRLDPKVKWGTKDYYESVGNNSGSGSTLDKIEFHFFDNTPTYTSSDTAAWLTEKGWCHNTESEGTTLYDESYTYSADIIGGARQFSKDEDFRTAGGIRYSTITSASPAFKYIDSQAKNIVPTKDFVSGISGIYIGAKASLFTGYSALRHSPSNPDDLYFGLGLSETDIPVSKSFTVSYDDSKAYITDLAGNRLRSTTIKTIDRTPPSFDIVISPINQKEVYMVFVKNVVTDSSAIRYINNDGNVIPISESFETLIPKCFDIVSINADGEGEISETHHIDYSVPAKFEHIKSEANEEEFTSIKLSLKEPVTLQAIENMYLRIIYPEGYDEFSRDPVTSINDTQVTLIQDKLGNYIQMYDLHALSDFAVSSINPLYAYDADMTYNGENIMNGLYEEGSWAVHDWNADQQNYGTLPANHPYGIVADIENGTGQADFIPAGVRIFLSANPDADSISKQYNSDLNQNLRIWLPEVEKGLFLSLSLINNSKDNYVQIDSTLLNKDESPFRIHFEIPKEISEAWGAEQQISFVFGLLNKDGSPLRIYPSPYHNGATGKYDLSLSDALPLYAFRLKDPLDITSIDLWSFKTHALTEQRGGVTILNNVINASKGEKTVVKVNMPSSGKLNVMVMTLDGNIISYLNHGQTEAGEHYFSWDGKNKNKGLVARGMYFIRVVGSGLDETRKVMVVK